MDSIWEEGNRVLLPLGWTRRDPYFFVWWEKSGAGIIWHVSENDAYGWVGRRWKDKDYARKWYERCEAILSQSGDGPFDVGPFDASDGPLMVVEELNRCVSAL